MGTVLLLTQGTGGDLYPFMQIGRGLRARGHQVTLITEPKFEAEVRRAGFELSSMLQPGHVDPPENGYDPEEQSEDGTIINPRILGACMHIYNAIKDRRRPGRTVLVGPYNLNTTAPSAA